MIGDPKAKSRFNAYLSRDRLCSGGVAAPFWSADGDAFFIPGDGRDSPLFWSLDLSSGQRIAAPEGPPIRTEVAGGPPRMWMRGGFVGEVPSPEVPSPDGHWYASIKDGDIVLRSARDGRYQAITSEATPDQTWDIEAERGRILPGLQAGTTFVSPWRPDSQALFACLRDTSGVFRLPGIHWLKSFEEVEITPFQKAGARIDRFHPHLVDICSGVATSLDIGDVEDRYVQFLGWRPDGGEALLIVYGRDLKRVDILAADATTGAVRTLVTEHAATFVKLQHETLLAGAHGFTMLPDGSGFLWLSTRSGFNHIHHYAMDGQLLGKLTNGDWPVHDVHHVGSDGFVYFTAAIDAARPYDIHVCRIPLEGGDVTQLTQETGIHHPTFAPGGGSFLDVHSSVDRPTRSDLRRSAGALVETVAAMDIAALEAVGYTPAEEFVVKAADGETDLWGVMYKPADFDASRRYPVIDHIYGGPQIVATARQFSVFGRPARNLPWALAQLGYVVVCLDARGTPGRSKAFQDVVYGAWGVHEIADHAAAIRQLLTRHDFLDGSRVGMAGHSWGGYFSTLALVQAPQLFSVAVSSSPGYEPRDSILYEPYLDLPNRNPEAYDKADLRRHAANVRGALMIVSGSSEFPVFSNALRMSRALIDEGVSHELVILPGEHHAYTGAREAYFIDKLTAWFDRHLMNKVP